MKRPRALPSPRRSAPSPSAGTYPSPGPPKLKLTYLNIKGIAEPIRLALHIAGIEFEDERITYEQIAERREAGALPNGQVPILEIDGVVYSQSAALLRWAGRLAGLLPDNHDAMSNDLAELRCDEVHEAIADLNASLKPQWYGHALGRSPKSGTMLVPLSQDQKNAVSTSLHEEVLPVRLARLEEALGDKEYFCGDALATCDLQWYVVGSGLRDGSYCAGISPSVLDATPKLVKLIDRIDRDPRVVEWNAAHEV